MTRLKIAEILKASPVEPEHLDLARVELYRRLLESFPPVVVFETEEGFLLADGYHRVAAALREGRETIEAEVRAGSRSDALDYAAEVGARQRGLSAREAREHVLKRYPESGDG